MTLHLIKLSVGPDSLADLARWQNARLKEKKKKREPLLLQHVTRMTPKRAEELLNGGSIYWVIKGQIVARQTLVDLKPVKKNGKPHCAIVYQPKLILVARRRHRPFQGWRYLLPKDAPPDITDPKSAKNLPQSLKVELADLGLL
ncbi:MAG TPA: DUF1489 domain-containing protein [Rhizomicrobium sp.]